MGGKKRFQVEMTCVYFGTAIVEAENEDEALKIVEESLDNEGLKDFPNEVKVPYGTFTFSAATADNAYDAYEINKEENQ